MVCIFRIIRRFEAVEKLRETVTPKICSLGELNSQRLLLKRTAGHHNSREPDSGSLAIPKRVLKRSSYVRALDMSISPHLAKLSSQDIERYIEENLSAYQVRWLTMQSQALRHPRTRIFKAILSDWLSRHSSRDRQQTADVDIARRAMDEFISPQWFSSELDSLDPLRSARTGSYRPGLRSMGQWLIGFPR
jgi:hypothetical protein